MSKYSLPPFISFNVESCSLCIHYISWFIILWEFAQLSPHVNVNPVKIQSVCVSTLLNGYCSSKTHLSLLYLVVLSVFSLLIPFQLICIQTIIWTTRLVFFCIKANVNILKLRCFEIRTKGFYSWDRPGLGLVCLFNWESHPIIYIFISNFIHLIALVLVLRHNAKILLEHRNLIIPSPSANASLKSSDCYAH